MCDFKDPLILVNFAICLNKKREGLVAVIQTSVNIMAMKIVSTKHCLTNAKVYNFHEAYGLVRANSPPMFSFPIKVQFCGPFTL